MPDMLVRLYDLPPLQPPLTRLTSSGIVIKRAIAPEKAAVSKWVGEKFGSGWASECEVAFSNHPVSCMIAVSGGNICGFACYEATCRDFFGPTGVDTAMRGKGVGGALLLACMHAMAAQGYAYAIIGGAGPQDFYRKTLHAISIPDSEPGIYRNMLGKL